MGREIRGRLAPLLLTEKRPWRELHPLPQCLGVRLESAGKLNHAQRPIAGVPTGGDAPGETRDRRYSAGSRGRAPRRPRGGAPRWSARSIRRRRCFPPSARRIAQSARCAAPVGSGGGRRDSRRCASSDWSSTGFTGRKAGEERSSCTTIIPACPAAARLLASRPFSTRKPHL